MYPEHSPGTERGLVGEGILYVIRIPYTARLWSTTMDDTPPPDEARADVLAMIAYLDDETVLALWRLLRSIWRPWGWWREGDGGGAHAP